jgi:hypothetical protein
VHENSRISATLPVILEIQRDELNFGKLASVELLPSTGQPSPGGFVILMMIRRTESEADTWYLRAEQARRIASMLSPRDADLVLAYARECEDKAQVAQADTVAKTPIARDVRPHSSPTARRKRAA